MSVVKSIQKIEKKSSTSQRKPVGIYYAHFLFIEVHAGIRNSRKLSNIAHILAMFLVLRLSFSLFVSRSYALSMADVAEFGFIMKLLLVSRFRVAHWPGEKLSIQQLRSYISGRHC